MANNSKQSKRTPARPAVDQLFEDTPQFARDALAMHKAEKRRTDRESFARRQGLNPDIET